MGKAGTILFVPCHQGHHSGPPGFQASVCSLDDVDLPGPGEHKHPDHLYLWVSSLTPPLCAPTCESPGQGSWIDRQQGFT